jgi:hypothetical protein
MRIADAVAAVLFASALSAVSSGAQQPTPQGAPAARLELRTSSEQAKTLFRNAFFRGAKHRWSHANSPRH